MRRPMPTHSHGSGSQLARAPALRPQAPCCALAPGFCLIGRDLHPVRDKAHSMPERTLSLRGHGLGHLPSTVASRHSTRLFKLCWIRENRLQGVDLDAACKGYSTVRTSRLIACCVILVGLSIARPPRLPVEARSPSDLPRNPPLPRPRPGPPQPPRGTDLEGQARVAPPARLPPPHPVGPRDSRRAHRPDLPRAIPRGA